MIDAVELNGQGNGRDQAKDVQQADEQEYSGRGRKQSPPFNCPIAARRYQPAGQEPHQSRGDEQRQQEHPPADASQRDWNDVGQKGEQTEAMEAEPQPVTGAPHLGHLVDHLAPTSSARNTAGRAAVLLLRYRTTYALSSPP